MSPTKNVLLVILGLAAGGLLVTVGLFGGWLLFDRTPTGEGPRDPAGGTAKTLPGVLAPDVLARAREATVFIQVRGVSYLDQQKVVEGSGTGFLVTSDGRVVTNWHVISPLKQFPGFVMPARTDDLQVIVRSGARDQEVLPARILAADPETDLALLKVEKEGCTFLPLADSHEVMETAPVWILGFPFGQLFSVLQRGPEISINQGSVTSLRHDDLGNLRKIQFDAAVNRGNSGGPLILSDGKVLGIANIAIGSSRVNLAVPVALLKNLLRECPNDRSVGEDCRIRVTSEPAEATVYLNSKRLGVTPLTATVPGGYGRLVVAAPGRRLWTRNLSLYDGRKIHAEPKPRKTAVLKLAPAKADPASGATPMARGKTILSETFTNPEAAEAWKQRTGGEDMRTWYVQDGALNQFAADELLHAVFAGDRKWTDYAFSSRVRIETNERDGRAGLIFGATEEGFALFRLFRESSKIQLAHHTDNPFGWQILAERSLPFSVQGDTWYRMEVQTRGDQILCLLDGKVVLEATTDRVLQGKVGFYSVDSRARFDDALVSAVTDGEPSRKSQVSLRSFWFTDQFAKDSGFWQAYQDHVPGAPWPVVPGGCLQVNDGAVARMNILDCYDIYDCAIRCVVSSCSGTVGVVFRHDPKRRYIFAVNLDEETAVLFLEQEGKKKELKKADLSELVEKAPPSLFDSQDLFLLLLRVEVRGEQIRAGVNNAMLLEVADKTLKNGRIGLYTNNAKAVFHNVTVSSPREEGEEAIGP